jgi:RNA polymerase sigma factor (TIGR02999 family)
MNEVTRILSAVGRRDPNAASKLLTLVYDELRKLAGQRMSQEQPGQTLQATALVHEAYLRLVDTDKSKRWDSRGHFFGAAAEAMRRILVDNARRKRRPKHGGDLERVDLEEAVAVIPSPATDLLALDEALTKLAAQEPVKAELVKLRFFAGLNKDNPCRCPKKTRGFIQAGHVDPLRLRFVPEHVERIRDVASERFREIDDAVAVRHAAIYRDHPFLRPSDQVAWVRGLLERDEVRAALNLH